MSHTTHVGDGALRGLGDGHQVQLLGVGLLRHELARQALLEDGVPAEMSRVRTEQLVSNNTKVVRTCVCYLFPSRTRAFFDHLKQGIF